MTAPASVELVPFRAFHDGPELVAVIEAAAFVQAPWPAHWRW